MKYPKVQKVVTLQTPGGQNTVNVTLPIYRQIEQGTLVPPRSRWGEFCSVKRGAHMGVATWPAEEN